MNEWGTGDIVDLFDFGFDQWRGKYIVMSSSVPRLVKIKNQGTGSQQFVSSSRLRRSVSPQFFIKSLAAS
jgi:hypothetical protein